MGQLIHLVVQQILPLYRCILQTFVSLEMPQKKILSQTLSDVILSIKIVHERRLNL